MYAYSNNGMSMRAVSPDYVAQSGEVMFPGIASPEQLAAVFPEYAASVAEENSDSLYHAAVSAGVMLISSSTPSLNGTYSLTEAARGNIQAAYIGLKSGDGLPGGGASFNYPDQNGGAHIFTATTFPPFAIAMRDYYYALTQGQSPAQPVTIP